MYMFLVTCEEGHIKPGLLRQYSIMRSISLYLYLYLFVYVNVFVSSDLHSMFSSLFATVCVHMVCLCGYVYVSPSVYVSPDLQRRCSILCALVAVTLRGCNVYLYVYAHVDVCVCVAVRVGVCGLSSMFSVCCGCLCCRHICLHRVRKYPLQHTCNTSTQPPREYIYTYIHVHV